MEANVLTVDANTVNKTSEGRRNMYNSERHRSGFSHLYSNLDSEHDETVQGSVTSVQNATEHQENVASNDNQVAGLLKQLKVCIDHNTEVLQQAMETMQVVTRSMNRTPVQNDELVIPDTKRPDKVTVELKCTFLKIAEIDTITQQFEADLFVQAKWEEPSLAMLENSTQAIEDFDKLIPWDPKLIVMNIDGAFLLNRRTYDIRLHEPGYKYPLVIQMWRFMGLFKENLELQHFPVDVQELTVSISTERSCSEVDLIEDQTALSSINTKTFMDQQEWNLYNHIETFRDFTAVEYCSSTVHPILHAQCRVARKVGYFGWNIVFIMLLINSLTFAAYAIEYTSPDRLMVTITLFLTAVAFKLVVKQSLPTISYLTYLDEYVIASLIFLGMQAAQNTTMNLLSRFLTKKQVEFCDKTTMVFMAFVLILFHACFGIYIYHTASKRRRIMAEKDKMYASRREFLLQYGTLPQRTESATERLADYYDTLANLSLSLEKPKQNRL
ncbi:uncharacterized protein LOC127856368 isoform X2 [Dreissena polymorpha]|uniref:uncharacterized protein LOC127856368 isoform X2 n=1 Tax=Dreissena polymorpha TaxID=45954 RepID=UPI002263B403|nr:uncharacterized protein LOC127856368 isoform X2 [Dreissena polymorpha]